MQKYLPIFLTGFALLALSACDDSNKNSKPAETPPAASDMTTEPVSPTAPPAAPPASTSPAAPAPLTSPSDGGTSPAPAN